MLKHSPVRGTTFFAWLAFVAGILALGCAGVAAMSIRPAETSPAKTVIPVVSMTTSTPRAWQTGGMPTTDTPMVSSTNAHLLFMGDIMLDRNVAARMATAHDLAYSFRKLPVGWFQSFDYRVANLEGPVTATRRPPDKSIDFMFNPDVAPMLKAQGIDAVSQANNHSLDQGTQGYLESVATLRAAGLLVFGNEVRDDEVALATTTVNGLKIAFLGFNTTESPLDKVAAARVIAEAKASSDKVIVFMHWGLEYRATPPQSVIDLSHWLIDQGVDVIIGGHPHWIQGIYEYKGKPIVYSLGNFVFDQDWSETTKQGLAMGLTFTSSSVVFEPIPLQIDKSQPHVLTGSDKAQRLQALAAISDPSLTSEIEADNVVFKY